MHAASAQTSLPGFLMQTVAVNGPVDGQMLPLVVISHGHAGSYAVHYDTALALADAGFVVAAVTHTGDTFPDQSRVLRTWGRPAHLRRLIDYMLDEWPEHERIDAHRRAGWSKSGHKGKTECLPTI
jgi:predicted dienelactone hydrolase